MLSTSEGGLWALKPTQPVVNLTQSKDVILYVPIGQTQEEDLSSTV